MPLPPKQEALMRWILFGVFLSIFVMAVAGTLGALFFGFGHLTDRERDVLFTTFIVEVGAAIGVLFYSIFKLTRTSAGPARVRLSLGEFSDVRTLTGKTATLAPSKADGSSLDEVSVKVLNDNGPCIPLELPEPAYSVYVTVDTGHKRFSGSFIVGTYLVDLEEEADNGD